MATNILSDNELMAAIDLGSNSFHLAIARLDHGEVRKVVSMSEKVQLAAGLDEDNVLNEQAQQRGLDCLARFIGRLDSVAPERLRIVATNALRQATNADEFIKQANAILPKPIEIIAGREEARLIYLGVSHNNANINVSNANSDQRLVIDIGGGSTEYIIGKAFEPLLTESLQMGCVAFTKAFFDDGEISETAYDNAVAAARKKLLVISNTYQKTGWDCVIGSSGTIKAVKKVLVAQGWADEQERITFDGLKKLEQLLFDIKHVDNIELEGVKEHRKSVFPAGVAILRAAMNVLGIEKITYSDSALREGVMYDMLGRFASEDVRDRSVQALMQRYSVDKSQAQRVVDTSQLLFQQVFRRLHLDNEDGDLLRRVAYLYEIGLAVSHSGHHKHGAYLLEHSDIPGFSQIDQLKMAQLLLNHRKKLKSELLLKTQEVGGDNLKFLCLLLRLAVLIHHSRCDYEQANFALEADDKVHWHLQIIANGEDMSLLLSDLQEEIPQFEKWGVLLSVELIEE